LFAPKAPVSGFARAYAFEELGNTYLAQEEFGNAEVAYATAVEADSSNVRLAGNLGSVRLLTGNVEGAIQVLESATRREPGNAVLLYQLADAYRGAGRLDDAAAAYRAAITANPTLLDAYLVLAALQRDRGEMGAAVGVLSDAQKRFPNSGLVKLNLGRVYEQSGMPEEAMAAYRDGLELLPGDNGAAFNLARLYMNSDHPTEAVAVLEALVRRDPGDVEAWINLGGALDRLGRKEPSVEAFRQANRLDPGRPEPYFNLARSYMIDSRPDLAMQVLQRYAAFDSTSDAGMRAKALLRRLRAEAVADTMP